MNEKAKGTNQKRILFVINPRSGKREVSHLADLISLQSKLSGFDFQIHIMDGEHEEVSISKKIRAYRPQLLAAVGGDGTVNLVAGLLAGTDIILLIIPNGSANGMARELGINIRPEQALALLENGVIKAIDAIRINRKIGIHLADVGLNARIVKRFEADHTRGIATYAKHLFREMFLLKRYRFTIHYNDKIVKRKAVSITFANASRYGTGAVINPRGIIDDGKFELVIVKPFPQIKLLSIAWKMFRNTLHTSDYVEVISCSQAHISVNKKTTLQVDGEVIGKVKEIKIEMLHKAVKIVVPEPLPGPLWGRGSV
jgi:diacylglycerol kinase (ATP)